MRAAVIDIGTNSVKLTVADVADDVTIVDEDSKITRLGKDVDSAKKLNADAMSKTIKAIHAFVERAQENGAAKIMTVGTSALRDASNGSQFIADVKSACGLDVEIISGSREASLSYTAVVSDSAMVTDAQARVLIFDIGGGSTELNYGTSGKLVKHVSLNIGAVRLTERHIPSDPPTAAEIKAATDDAAKEIHGFVDQIGPISAVCGVGGTAVTLAAVVHGTSNVHGKTVTAEALAQCLEKLSAMPVAERRKVEFLEPERADIIIAGGAILRSLLTEANADSYRVSVRGMRYGLMLEMRSA
jgi:exopolyphosphatase/guanosine-5'-triphosphate,3'-diphosphate pyrophosphatase